MDLFETQESALRRDVPLADRMRPAGWEDFAGQDHLVGMDGVLRNLVDRGNLPSAIFWGPPGVGKTTLARLIAKEMSADFVALSAVTAGVKDVRQVIDRAVRRRPTRTILFVDEIHRFNKAQQDALLHSVEDGTVTLMGATTENPSFEVIAPLLSRCRVFRLNELSEHDIVRILDRALETDDTLMKMPAKLDDTVKPGIARLSAGDARTALNTLDISIKLAPEKDGVRRVTWDIVQKAAQRSLRLYDKAGDAHYDTISAFIKSMRGSDPDGAMLWLAKMLDAGEDPLFIARRMIVLASEDVGNADPFGLVLANAAFQAAHAVGMPEARIILAHAANYLASAPKSNASYIAVEEAFRDAREMGDLPVPMHLRNAPTGLMKASGYGDGYKYAHDFEGGFTEQSHLPDSLKDRIYYRPKAIGRETEIKKRLEGWWAKRRNPFKK